jgi:hypothetical protein
MLETIISEIALELWVLLETALFAVLIGVWSYVFDYLQKPEHIFARAPEIANRAVSFGKHGARMWWNKSNWQEVVLKWMGECPICHAGFVAVCLYPFLCEKWQYVAINHIAFIVIAIFTSIKLNDREQ